MHSKKKYLVGVLFWLCSTYAYCAPYTCNTAKKEITAAIGTVSGIPTNELLSCMASHRVCVATAAKVWSAKDVDFIDNESIGLPAKFVVIQSGPGDAKRVCLYAHPGPGPKAAWLARAFKILHGKRYEYSGLKPILIVAGARARRAAGRVDFSFRIHGKDPECTLLATPEEFNRASAMRAIECHYNKDQNGTLFPYELTTPWKLEDASNLYTPLLARTYKEDGERRAVLVMGSQSINQGKIVDTYGTQEDISVFVFRFEANHWALAQSKRHIGLLGTHGTFGGTTTFAEIGRGRHGVVFSGGWKHDGQAGSYIQIISLSQSEPKWIADIAIGGGYDGPEGTYSYNGDWSFVKDASKAYYPIRIKYHGTNASSGARHVMPYNKVVMYGYHGNQYGREPTAGPGDAGEESVAFNEREAFGDLFGATFAKLDGWTLVRWPHLSPMESPNRWMKMSSIQHYTDSTGKKIALFVQSVRDDSGRPESCHACQAEVSIFIFGQSQGYWRLIQDGWGVTYTGSSGHIGPQTMVKIGPNHWGIVVHNTDWQMGEETKWINIIGIMDNGIRTLIKKGLVTSDNNSGNCGPDPRSPGVGYERCIGFDVSVNWISGKNPAFYDLETHKTGTKWVQKTGKVEQVDEVDRYELRRGIYSLVQKTSKPVKIIGPLDLP